MRKLLTGLSLASTLSALALGTIASTAAYADGAVNVSSKPMHLQASRQDPLNGQLTPIPLPLDKLPGPAQDLFSTPVGSALNSFWSGTAAPALCNYGTGYLNGLGQGDFHLHGTECSLAQGGTVTATDEGDKVVLDYYLPGNVIKTWLTTPITCAPGHGTIFCPVDPEVSLTLDVELQATIETPGLACDAHIDPFAVHVHNVVLDSQNWTADLGFDVVDMIGAFTGTDYVSMADNMITQGVEKMNNNAGQVQQGITGKVAAFTSSLCNAIIPSLPGASDIWELHANVDPVQGIVFQLTDEPPVPSLFGAELHSDQATVTPGSSVVVSGQYFSAHGAPVTITGSSGTSSSTSSKPLNTVEARLRPVAGNTTLGTTTVSGNGTFSTTVTIPDNAAAGAYTLRASAGSQSATVAVQVVAKGGSGTLFVSYQGHTYTNIATGDSFNLSGLNLTPGAVTIYLDSPSGLQVGSATVGADGKFSQDFTLTYDQVGKLGPRTLVAVQNGSVVAQLDVTFVLPEVIH